MVLSIAKQLAEELMEEHLLTKHGWTFRFDNARKRFGCTRYRSRQITLSATLTQLNGIDVVKDTILHEIAHAIAGHGAGHGDLWKYTAKNIGCSAKRTFSNREVIMPPSINDVMHFGVCPNCNHKVARLRRNKIACGQCCRKYNGGKFNPAYLIVWQS